eukprot:PhM_4_TR16434/c0_g1_i1/m.3699
MDTEERDVLRAIACHLRAALKILQQTSDAGNDDTVRHITAADIVTRQRLHVLAEARRSATPTTVFYRMSTKQSKDGVLTTRFRRANNININNNADRKVAWSRGNPSPKGRRPHPHQPRSYYYSDDDDDKNNMSPARERSCSTSSSLHDAVGGRRRAFPDARRRDFSPSSSILALSSSSVVARAKQEIDQTRSSKARLSPTRIQPTTTTPRNRVKSPRSTVLDHQRDDRHTSPPRRNSGGMMWSIPATSPPKETKRATPTPMRRAAAAADNNNVRVSPPRRSSSVGWPRGRVVSPSPLRTSLPSKDTSPQRRRSRTSPENAAVASIIVSPARTSPPKATNAGRYPTLNHLSGGGSLTSSSAVSNRKVLDSLEELWSSL